MHLALTLSELADEVRDEERDVLGPFAQRRYPNREHVQSIEEIGAKGALLNHLLEILVGRGDHSHVNRGRAATATQSLNLMLLERSEQFGLHFQRQVADLVQEQRATVCGLKSSDSLRDRACECSTFVTEQFAFEQARRNRGAIDRNESLLPPRAGVMNRPRNHFFAGPRLAEQQHRAVHGRNHGDRLGDFSESHAVTNQWTSHARSSSTNPSGVVRRPCDVFQQVATIERFHQEGDRAIPQCLLANVIVIMGGDEDDRQLTPLASSPPLQFRPVHTGETHVCDDARHARQHT